MHTTCIILFFFLQCSVSCGYGFRLRNITCPESRTCDVTIRPEDKEICGPLECIPPTQNVIDLIDIPEQTNENDYERREFVENDRILQDVSTIPSSALPTATTKTPATTDGVHMTSQQDLIQEAPVSMLDIKEGGSSVLIDEQLPSEETEVDEIVHSKEKPEETSQGTPKPTQHKHLHSHSVFANHKAVQPSGVHVHADKLPSMPALPDIKNFRPLPKLPSLSNILTNPRMRMGPSSMIVPSVYEWVPKTWNPVSLHKRLRFSL